MATAISVAENRCSEPRRTPTRPRFRMNTMFVSL